MPKDSGVNVPRLQLYSQEGELVRERLFTYEDRNRLTGFFTTDLESHSNFFLVCSDGTIEEIDSRLETVNANNRFRTFNVPLKIIDIDNKHISLKLNGSNPSQLSVHLNNLWSLYDYQRNPFYKMRFLFWAAIYIGVLLFILLIRKLQRVQLQKKVKIQNQISEMQLKSIKNQIDPHFTFNTINAINSLIYKEDRDTAYHLTSKFSNLIRSSLENSDKIQTTLKEEINFITNWLDLQKFRFQNKFDYEIGIAENINLQMEIPRNILQTYVENAIKHGLKHREKDGFLKINILHINKHLQISITDNGIGRKAASEKSKFSTGKGLGIMEQIFELYEQLYNISISQEIIDLYGDEGNAAGTKVLIKMPL